MRYGDIIAYLHTISELFFQMVYFHVSGVISFKFNSEILLLKNSTDVCLTDCPMDGPTHPLIELQERIEKLIQDHHNA